MCVYFLKRDVLQFLKLHDCYLRVNYHVSEYTLYWKRVYADPITGIETHFDKRKGQHSQHHWYAMPSLWQQINPFTKLHSDPTTTVAMKSEKINNRTLKYILKWKAQCFR